MSCRTRFYTLRTRSREELTTLAKDLGPNLIPPANAISRERVPIVQLGLVAVIQRHQEKPVLGVTRIRRLVRWCRSGGSTAALPDSLAEISP